VYTANIGHLSYNTQRSQVGSICTVLGRPSTCNVMRSNGSSAVVKLQGRSVFVDNLQ